MGKKIDRTLRVMELGTKVKIFNSYGRLISGFIFVEAKEILEYGQLLTWGKNRFRAKPCNKHQTICGAATRNMDKGERDLVRFYGRTDVKVKK